MIKLKNKINVLNLNYKKELIKIISISLLIIIGTLYFAYSLKKFYLIVIGIFAIGVQLELFSFSYDKKISILNKQNETEFVAVLNYIKTYLHNGFNVYKSLEETIQYVSPWMQNKLGTLITEIDKDKSIAPFINFAHSFESSIIEQVLIA